MTGDQLEQVVAGEWRAWPVDSDVQTTRSFDDAKATAQRLARTAGVAHLVRLSVSQHLFAHQETGAGHTMNPDDLMAHLTSPIVEHAEYRGPVSERQVRAAELLLGAALPALWCRYLTGDCWFHRGWMDSGSYVWLYSPQQSAEIPSAGFVPGMLVIGGNGASEQLVLDLRESNHRVLLANVVLNGWDEAHVQAHSISSFLEAVEGGSFEFSFG